MIEREGPTTVMYAGVRYDFVQNRNGDKVCDVNSPGAVAYFIETLMGNYYQQYFGVEKPVEEKEVVKRPEPKNDLKIRYNHMKSKGEVEVACRTDFGVDLDRRKGLGKMKAEVFALIDKE